MAFLGGLFDPPAANVQAPPTWQNTAGMDTASAGALGGIGNLSQFNAAGQNLGQYSNIAQGMVNNPYAGQYIGGAQYGGAMGQQAAQNQFGQGGNLYSMAGQIAQTGFDPQNALYGRTQQQLMDQTRAGQAARGVAMTPYGAGLEDQQNRNFNIDWQNAQLGRQTQAGQAAGGLIGQGAQLQGGAGSMYGNASAMPYNAAQQVGTNQLGTLNQLGQYGQTAQQGAQQSIQDYLNYIGQGNQANSVAQQGFANQLNQANQGFNQQQTMFGNLGNLAGNLMTGGMFSGLGSMFSGGGGGYYGGSPESNPNLRPY